MLQAKDASSVEYRNLSDADKKTFDKARHAEMQGLFSLGTYRLLSLEESERFREQFPDYVLPSRWVDRWKGTDEGGLLAKSRIVILGFKDPHILEFERSAPTPTNEALTTIMQCRASTGADAISSDIKNAFGRSMQTNRQNNICASVP